MIKDLNISCRNNVNLEPKKIIYNLEIYERIPYGCERFKLKSSKCSDCGCKLNSLHHLGCDIERCPRCGGQLMTCNCIFEIFKGEENL